MKIAIAGGSGLIGTKITNFLVEKGHSIYILTRNTSNKPEKPHIHYVEWLNEHSKAEEQLEGVTTFINLAGESIANGRWTSERKKSILNSRINATRSLIEIMSKLTSKPEVLINASAIGYYGVSLTETYTEKSVPDADDFLAEVVKKWEYEATKATMLGIRVVCCRLGIVLDQKEGALQRIITPYRLFAGGTIGSGEQWLSWIHIDDVVSMFTFAINNQEIEGPFNITAPLPVQMKEFGKTVATVLNKPHWLPVPGFALKLLLGDMSTLVINGQKVHSVIAEKLHYPYKYRTLNAALKDLLR